MESMSRWLEDVSLQFMKQSFWFQSRFKYNKDVNQLWIFLSWGNIEKINKNPKNNRTCVMSFQMHSLTNNNLNFEVCGPSDRESESLPKSEREFVGRDPTSSPTVAPFPFFPTLFFPYFTDFLPLFLHS